MNKECKDCCQQLYNCPCSKVDLFFSNKVSTELNFVESLEHKTGSSWALDMLLAALNPEGGRTNA